MATRHMVSLSVVLQNEFHLFLHPKSKFHIPSSLGANSTCGLSAIRRPTERGRGPGTWARPGPAADRCMCHSEHGAVTADQIGPLTIARKEHGEDPDRTRPSEEECSPAAPFSLFMSTSVSLSVCAGHPSNYMHPFFLYEEGKTTD